MEGYDYLISKLKLAAIEQKVPGNYERLKALQDTHNGGRCFVICNGPSLKAEDLDVLHVHQVFSYASNRISAIFPETAWRPDVWGTADFEYYDYYAQVGKEYKESQIMLTGEALLEGGLLFENAVYVPFLHVMRTPRWFNADITLGVHHYFMVTGLLLSYAVYMGFKDIYLLGADASYPVKEKDGKSVMDWSQPTHFSKDYFPKDMQDRGVENLVDMNKAVERSLQSYKDIKMHCEKLGVTIYNATRGGVLEVFPRVSFDEIQW